MRIITCICLSAFVASGCAANRMARTSQVLQSYHSVLHAELSTSLVTVAVGQYLPLHFTLTNTGRIPIDACIGLARQYSIVSDSRTVELKHLVDHPICSGRFQLQNGEHIAWDEEFKIPELMVGQTRIAAAIQIVNPRDCDKYGCYDTMLDVSPIAIEVPKP